MDCLIIRERLNEYLDREISPEQAAVVEDHLARCGPCREALDDLRRTAAAVGDLRRVRAPEGFADEVMDRLARNELIGEPAGRPAEIVPVRPFARRLMPVFSAAAAVIVVAFGFLWFSRHREMGPLPVRTPMEREISRLAPADSPDKAHTPRTGAESGEGKFLERARAGHPVAAMPEPLGGAGRGYGGRSAKIAAAPGGAEAKSGSGRIQGESGVVPPAPSVPAEEPRAREGAGGGLVAKSATSSPAPAGEKEFKTEGSRAREADIEESVGFAGKSSKDADTKAKGMPFDLAESQEKLRDASAAAVAELRKGAVSPGRTTGVGRAVPVPEGVFCEDVAKAAKSFEAALQAARIPCRAIVGEGGERRIFCGPAAEAGPVRAKLRAVAGIRWESPGRDADKKSNAEEGAPANVGGGQADALANNVSRPSGDFTKAAVLQGDAGRALGEDGGPAGKKGLEARVVRAVEDKPRMEDGAIPFLHIDKGSADGVTPGMAFGDADGVASDFLLVIVDTGKNSARGVVEKAPPAGAIVRRIVQRPDAYVVFILKPEPVPVENR
ncbi:MAG: zf-HC2 domain-containing protein [Planctomycetota bacterium]